VRRFTSSVSRRYWELEERWRDGAIFCALGVCLAGYYFLPLVWLSALAALLFLVLAWLRLDLGLLYVVFAAPFYRFPKRFDLAGLGLGGLLQRTEPLAFSLAEFAVLACLVAWLARQVLPEPGQREETRAPSLKLFSRQWQWTDLLNPPFIFLLISTLSLFASEYLTFSIREYRTVILEPLLFYFLLVHTVDDRRGIWRFLNAFVLLSAVVALASLYHYFFIGVVEATGGVRRILAVYWSPNALALFLGRGLPMTVTLALFAREKRWLYALASLAIVVCLYFTYSRGAWVGVAFALLFVAALRGSRRLLALGGTVAVAVGSVLAFFLRERFISSNTIQQRFHLWQAAVNMIRDHPILGVGLDNFLYQYPNYILKEAWAEPNLSHPHNILLDFWTRLGILGVGAMLWLQVTFWRAGFRICKGWKGEEGQIWALALMASMVDFLIHGLLDNSFFLIDLAFIFWLTYGLMRAMARLHDAVSLMEK